jgi:hypothetical protein
MMYDRMTSTMTIKSNFFDRINSGRIEMSTALFIKPLSPPHSLFPLSGYQETKIVGFLRSQLFYFIFILLPTF